MENLTIIQARKKLLAKEITATELVNYYLVQIEKKDKDIHAFLTVTKELALAQAKKVDEDYEYLKSHKLAGIPIAVKDVFCTKGIRTTCGSLVLDNFVPVYESTVTQKVLDEGAIILGKVNLDQFCHGSSTITSAYGPTRNPWDLSKLPGGSSGGSAAAVAADMCVAALGTETAGSIRLPSSWCGTTGIKPTYSRVSRFGVVAMGSSLDSPGPMTKTVEDGAYILEIIAGHDEKDFSSSTEPTEKYFENINPDKIKGIKLGIPKEFTALDLQPEVRERFNEAIEKLKALGAVVSEVSILDTKYSIATYTIMQRSEVSSNLARFDGTRYSPAGDIGKTVIEYYESVRGKGFGDEAKRRVMTGTYALSAGYADAFYKKGEEVRNMIKDNLNEVLSQVDAIIGPTTPTTALGDNEVNDPLFGEMIDVLAEGSSLTGLPAVSVPMGLADKLPIGLQFIGKHFDEQLLIDLSTAYQNSQK
jgi:aspartyl-tRNA(Asn)/glutamyl-tRNA(Gln) amidotransferase subunit A